MHGGRYQGRKERGGDKIAPEPMELDSLPVCDSGSDILSYFVRNACRSLDVGCQTAQVRTVVQPQTSVPNMNDWAKHC